MVGSRQGRYIAEGATVEDPHYALGTAYVQVVLPHSQTVGTGRLRQRTDRLTLMPSQNNYFIL